MIKFDKVSKVYKGDIIALDEITFYAKKGEFLFLVGPSGAGKSTVIRLLIRQEFPSQGEIVFEDILVTEIPRKMLAIYRQHLGVVFQDLNLIPSKTVRENVEFALEITQKPKKERREKTEHLLETVNLRNRSHLFPDDLSGGEKQKVAIARALANDPKLFIADEPTGNLDPETSLEILEILKGINKTGTTVLVVSHDKELVNAMNTRVIQMDKGKIVDDYVGGYEDRSDTKKSSDDKNKRSNSTQKSNDNIDE